MLSALFRQKSRSRYLIHSQLGSRFLTNFRGSPNVQISPGERQEQCVLLHFQFYAMVCISYHSR